jgi:hypothetical protein
MRIGQGFQFLALASDAVFMAGAAKQALGAIDFSGASADGAAAGGTLY